MKSDIKLRNLIFPSWALYMVPFVWHIILPANFLIDTIVVLAALAVMKTGNIKNTYKQVIFKIWGLGFAADILGSICLMIMLGFANDITQMKYRGLNYDPTVYPVGFVLVTISVIISGILIYVFNYYGHFKKLELEQGQKRKLALTLAVVTAPYLMYVPMDMLN